MTSYLGPARGSQPSEQPSYHAQVLCLSSAVLYCMLYLQCQHGWQAPSETMANVLLL